MAKVRDLLDAATRARLKAMTDEELEAAYTSFFPTREHDLVGTWPSDRLGELIEQRPDLLPELMRRRPGEVQQA
jgi:hypothetical protein